MVFVNVEDIIEEKLCFAPLHSLFSENFRVARLPSPLLSSPPPSLLRFCLLHVGSREPPIFHTPPRRLAFNLESDGASASSAMMGAENGHQPNNMNNSDQQNRGYDAAVPGPPRGNPYQHTLGVPASGSGSGGFSVGVMGRGENRDGNGFGRRTRRVRGSRIRLGGLEKCVGPNAR